MKVELSRWREYLLYLYVFALPVQTRWIMRDPLVQGGVWEYGRLSLYGWDILLVALILVSWPQLKCELASLARAMRAGAVDRAGQAFLFGLLFVAYVFLVVPWAQDVVLALSWAVRLVLSSIFVWLLVRVLKPQAACVWLSLAASGVLQAVWALAQFFTQRTLANKWLGVAAHPIGQAGTSVVLTHAGVWLRAYAGQVHPNVLGGWLVMSLLATVWLYARSSRFKIKILWLSLYTIQLAGLFVTFSRGAWLALFASLVIWWWRETAARERITHLGTLGILVFVIFGLVYSQPTLGRLTAASRLEQRSVEERLGSWQVTRVLLAQGFWRGLGAGGYTASFILQAPGLPAWQYQPVHNLFLLALVELGILGFVLWLGAIWTRIQLVGKVQLIWLVPIFLSSLFDHYWWTIPSMVALFWLVLALPAESSNTS